MKRTLLGACVALVTLCSGLSADTITLSTPEPNGVYATGDWAEGAGGFRIMSTVTYGPGVVHYDYWISSDTLVNPPNDYGELSKDLSYFLLEVSPNVPLSEIILPGTLDTHGVALESTPELDNHYKPQHSMPTSIYGVKFDLATNTGFLHLSFDSLRLPVLGNFFAKDGGQGANSTYAYNTGLDVNIEGNAKIWVPDTMAVPEPSTYALLGSTIALALGLQTLRRRRRLEPADGDA